MGESADGFEDSCDIAEACAPVFDLHGATVSTCDFDGAVAERLGFGEVHAGGELEQPVGADGAVADDVAVFPDDRFFVAVDRAAQEFGADAFPAGGVGVVDELGVLVDVGAELAFRACDAGASEREDVAEVRFLFEQLERRGALLVGYFDCVDLVGNGRFRYLFKISSAHSTLSSTRCPRGCPVFHSSRLARRLSCRTPLM